MTRAAWIMMAGLCLALSLAAVGLRGGDPEDEHLNKEVKEATQALVQMLETTGKTGNGKSEAKAIHAKFSKRLKPVMWAAFEARKKGGIGAGPEGPKDGIEERVLQWDSPRSRPLGRDDIIKQKGTLQRVAEVSRAMADVTAEYAPKNSLAKWKQYTDAMRKAAEELSRGTTAGDAAMVKKAIANLHGSCTDCHDFVDTLRPTR
jgi:hypothetical protein